MKTKPHTNSAPTRSAKTPTSKPKAVKLSKISTAKATKPATTKKVSVQPKKKPAVVPKVSLKKQTPISTGLKTAPDEQKFWLQTGEVLASLTELATSFALMDTLVYQHHVNKQKNDFALWVEQVLEDIACAEALRKAKTPRSARLIVVRHLKQFNS